MNDDYKQLNRLKVAHLLAVENGFEHTATAISKLLAQDVARMKRDAKRETSHRKQA